MGINIYFWIGFHIFIFLMLALDLGVFHKKTHKVPVKEAIIWSVVWISLAILFSICIHLFIYPDPDLGKTKALEFLTGYVIEYSLSVDNIFVFILIFSYFKVDDRYQHKVLFWGILGALIMRAIFIFAGVALINRFHWIVIIFGRFSWFLQGSECCFRKKLLLILRRIPLLDSSGNFFLLPMSFTETGYLLNKTGECTQHLYSWFLLLLKHLT